MKHFSLLILFLALINLQAYSQGKQARTKVIAHRGAWKNTNLPQNSLSALNAAIEMGCFASECDIWMTSDSVLVVNHDPHFYDMPIETTTYNELLNKKYPNGESIATLEQFLSTITKQKKTRLVLDIKPSKVSKERSIITARKSYEMVTAKKAQKIVDYILFDYDACLALEKLDAKANIAYLLGDRSPEQAEKDGLWGIDYSYRVFEKNPNWVNDAQQRKLTVNVWTVNDQAMAQSYIDQKVDFITTDEPEMVLKMVGKR
ncbi:glycerophosphodiester phosphodiesterase [Chryseosolibacter indicus]|uniref:Glycerophosphodiester phosphodiesterase n=1 Tax=Chryseosolibacter indicus TaxID=2782351 RepID=A0ABS5VV63_9BACT|nr:glycerophosphodiester phosphodiesterase family protein [Chryseosolibacter indicus]MBT1704759.1 glycerophosphodiester phosphodiesterase [Chryseosolibacter indicus]